MLQSLIEKNAKEPVVVHIDSNKARWAAKFFVIIAPKKADKATMESWEFAGVNDAKRFTVDTLNRKQLAVELGFFSLP